MGKQKYLEDIIGLFKKSIVVDFASISRVVKFKKNKNQYTKQLVRHLINQRKITKIDRGLYSIYNDPTLILFSFSSAYLGLQNALSFHNLWEQETNPVILTTNNVRKGVRKVMGMNVVIRSLNKKYFFGFEFYKYPLEDRDIYLPYSDIEKTFIDMIHFKQYMDEEVIVEFKARIVKKKLKEYLKVYPPKTKKRVMNVLDSGKYRFIF